MKKKLRVGLLINNDLIPAWSFKMLEKIKILLTKNKRKKCIFLFFGSIISSFFELIGIGSIPVFAMIIVDLDQLKSKLPSFVDQNLLDQFTHNQIALFGAMTLIIIFFFIKLYIEVNYALTIISPFFIHSLIPPFKFLTFLKPNSFIKDIALELRPPL